jgi:hypothetical protein
MDTGEEEPQEEKPLDLLRETCDKIFNIKDNITRDDGNIDKILLSIDIEEINTLDDFLNKFRGKRSTSISSFEFQRSDIQREEVVKEVLDIYGGDVPTDYTLDSNDDNSDS